jgi:hypothetical protein
MKKKPEPTIVVGHDLAEGTDRIEQFNAKISEHLEKFHPSPSDLRAILIPKFTVRGEHNVWHVYKNDERLEPPFRNQERAELERAHHERSHAIRNRSTEQPDGIV